MTILGDISPPHVAIGQSNYALLRRGGMTYVDKTMWAADILGSGSVIHVVPRPRRFGKTLNMSMLRYFVQRTDEDRADLFADTALWNADGGRYREHFQRYPTIYLSFKDLKATSWDDLWIALRQTLAEEFDRCMALLTAAGFAAEQPADVAWLEQLRTTGTPASYKAMLRKLNEWLHAATGERTIVLIDEYDAPLHAAWQHGYWETAVGFFRDFLSAGLKDNNDLHKGVLTGILKVAKEGIFSGLNHPDVATILTSHMSTRFGFTEDEVAELVDVTGCPDQLPVMQQWYNGYQFGQVPPHTMYNPWSILNFLNRYPDAPQAFWKNSSDNTLIRILLARHAAALGPHVETLLQGGTVTHTVDENVAMPMLDRQPGTVLGLLFFSGYLTTTSTVATRRGIECQLRIPNDEVKAVFEESFAATLEDAASRTGSATLQSLLDALLGGDTVMLEDMLGQLLVTMLSYHDVAGDRVESVYQAFVVGLLVHLDPTHRVYSNREAGHGRADVMIAPRTPGPGAVLELKRILPSETADTAINKAIAQLKDRDYAAEVRAAGATEVYQYAVVFDGKRCWVRQVQQATA
jgi:hypothetical protein